MRLTWTCGAVSVREFKDFAKTTLSGCPEFMQLLNPRSSLQQMMDAYDDLVVAEDDLKRAVEAESSGVPYTPSTAASPSAVLDQIRAALALAGVSGDVFSAIGELLAERLAAQAERDELRTELARLRSESRLSPPT